MDPLWFASYSKASTHIQRFVFQTLKMKFEKSTLAKFGNNVK